MMDEDDATYINPERIKQLGFKPQKEIVYNKLLPYADQLDVESKNAFAQIKINLSKSVMLRELHPGCSVWSARLTGLVYSWFHFYHKKLCYFIVYLIQFDYMVFIL